MRTEHLWRAVGVFASDSVLDPDGAAMRLDDLFGNRETEAGILAEPLVRTIGVEALKNLFERIGPDAWAVIVDADFDLVLQPTAGDAHRSARRRERARILDQIVDHLAEA